MCFCILDIVFCFNNGFVAMSYNVFSLMLERMLLTLSATCQQILGRNCQLWVPVQVSDPLEQVLQRCIG